MAKAGQLVENFTTNFAENWMSIHCKFDGGKVVNRSQSGSWEFHCMGAGLRMNIGSTWGPQVWKDTTGSAPSSVLVNTAYAAAKKCESDRKRKATDKSQTEQVCTN